MSEVHAFPVKIAPFAKGAISFKASILQTGGDGLVVGRVKVSDTDPFEIRVYMDEPEDVIKSQWVDFTDAGEVVFTVTTCNVVRHVAIDYAPFYRRVLFSLHLASEDAPPCWSREKLVTDWAGQAKRPYSLFTV